MPSMDDLQEDMQRSPRLKAKERYLDDACLQAFLAKNYSCYRSSKRP